MPQLTGIHHITAIASNPQRNINFYTNTLGLRLVKRTVNFDHPTTYHFYYGDQFGNPGTILTFFPWPNAVQGKLGYGQAAAFAYSIERSALDYWIDRFEMLDVPYTPPVERFGDQVIAFQDPDGLSLELSTREGLSTQPWEASPVPTEYALRGFAGITLSERDANLSGSFLNERLGAIKTSSEGHWQRYEIGGHASGAYIDIIAKPDESRGRVAAGSVHHIAWRTPDDSEQLKWREDLSQHGLHVTPVMDRQYFRSIYFREPGGVLFEIATDPPGFTRDESVQELGSALKLPPWLEDERDMIEGQLPYIELSRENTIG